MADAWLCITVLGEGGPLDTSPVSKGKSCSLAEPQPPHLSLVKIKSAPVSRGSTLLDTQEMLSLPSLPSGGAQILSSLGMAWGSNSPDLDCYVEKLTEAQSWLHGKDYCDRLVMFAMGRGLKSILCVP